MNIIDYTDYTIDLEDSDKGCVIRSYKCQKKGIEMKIFEKKNISGYKSWRVKLINDEGKKKHLIVARLIMQHFKPDEWDEKLQTDHIDCDSLNNRIDNLQMLTNQQNCQKKSSKANRNNTTSEHKNISYDRRDKLWIFKKVINGLIYRKTFKTEDEAVKFKKMFLIIHNCT